MTHDGKMSPHEYSILSLSCLVYSCGKVDRIHFHSETGLVIARTQYVRSAEFCQKDHRSLIARASKPVGTGLYACQA